MEVPSSPPAAESARLGSQAAAVACRRRRRRGFRFPFAGGALSQTLYLPDICGLPSPPPGAVNGGRPARWYAEVGERKSRSGLSETGALCRE